MANDTPASGALERAISIGKDLFALLRDFSLFLLAALLLMFPARLNDILMRAGFEEGSVVGFKWKSGLVESDEALKTAKATIDDLQRQLKQANEALAAAKAAVPAGELQQRIQKVEDAGRQALTASANAVEATRSTISANAALVDRALQTMSVPGGWAVVFGSDTTLAGARDEIARAGKLGIGSTGIYARNNYFASLAVVPSREQAQEYLQIARGFRPDAYLTRFSSWCRTPQQQDGYTSCQATK